MTSQECVGARVIDIQACELRTRRLIRKDEELLWSYGVTMCGKYSDYDPFAPAPYPLLVRKASTAASKPKAPKPSSPATPATSSKAASKPLKQQAPKPYIPESSPYGLDALEFNLAAAAADSGSAENSEGESEDSAESSEADDDDSVAPQPVYPEFSLTVHDEKRKIDILWEVRNEMSSNIAQSPYQTETKLHWRVIGLTNNRQKTELDCFMLMDVPVNIANVDGHSILSLTNASIATDQRRRGGDLTK